MINKKAQLTVIIIVAIAIVVGVLGTTLVISNKKTAADEAYFAQANIKPTLESIKSQTIDCVREVSKESLIKIGIQGGYHNNPKQYIALDSGFIVPYYYYLGTYLQPSKKEIESELNAYLNENLETCLNKINEPDYQITHNTPKARSIISENEVVFTIIQETQIKREDHIITLDLKDHPQTITSELDAIINLADYLTKSHKEDPELYCASCVTDIAQANDLFVDIIDYGDNEMLVIISETHTGEDPYSFEFLNKYTGKERTPELESIAAPNPNA